MSLLGAVAFSWFAIMALCSALVFTPAARFVIAVGWLLIAIFWILLVGPAVLVLNLLCRLGLVHARAPR